MKEKDIKEIIKALDNIGRAVNVIKTTLSRTLEDSSPLVSLQLNIDDEKSEKSFNEASPNIESISSSNNESKPNVVIDSVVTDSVVTKNESGKLTSKVQDSLNSKGKKQGEKPVDGFLNVLDLSGDIKKVQLALMRLGKATAADVAKSVSLDTDEVRIYLKTLMRDSAIVAMASKDSETIYRTVLKKKGKVKKAGSLLDKLL